MAPFYGWGSTTSRLEPLQRGSLLLAMLMMMSQMLKFVDFTKTKKSRYLQNKTFSPQIKKIINCVSRATLWQKIVNHR